MSAFIGKLINNNYCQIFKNYRQIYLHCKYNHKVEVRKDRATLLETNGHLTKHLSNVGFYSNSGYEVFRFLIISISL